MFLRRQVHFPAPYDGPPREAAHLSNLPGEHQVHRNALVPKYSQSRGGLHQRVRAADAPPASLQVGRTKQRQDKQSALQLQVLTNYERALPETSKPRVL